MTPLACGSPLPIETFAAIRRRMMLEFCKWDPQVEDVPTLCPFPLLLGEHDWRQLIRWSEQLSHETLSAERELLRRPDLVRHLGLPSTLRRLFCRFSQRDAAHEGPRIMRFDFHWTTDGWQLSEVNSDVPGGFIEASAFTELVRQHVPDSRTPGDPAGLYAEAIARRQVGTVGLVHATAYSDDRQVMIYLCQRLRDFRLETLLLSPSDIRWQVGRAAAQTGGAQRQVDLLVRFFPGEWLPNLARDTGWPAFFHGSRTPLSNPGSALLTQSKRLPLVWDQLATDLSTWRALLPETCDPRRVPWKRDERWVVKPAFGRVGDSIGLAGVTSSHDWAAIRRSVAWWPGHWVAQRRFEIVPLTPPAGVQAASVYPVIGVYTIDERVAGIYARLAPRPLIDHLAQDAAVLLPAEKPVTANGFSPSAWLAGVSHHGSD